MSRKKMIRDGCEVFGKAVRTADGLAYAWVDYNDGTRGLALMPEGQPIALVSAESETAEHMLAITLAGSSRRRAVYAEVGAMERGRMVAVRDGALVTFVRAALRRSPAPRPFEVRLDRKGWTLLASLAPRKWRTDVEVMKAASGMTYSVLP